jgi:hypothetical protein
VAYVDGDGAAKTSGDTRISPAGKRLRGGYLERGERKRLAPTAWTHAASGAHFVSGSYTAARHGRLFRERHAALLRARLHQGVMFFPDALAFLDCSRGAHPSSVLVALLLRHQLRSIDTFLIGGLSLHARRVLRERHRRRDRGGEQQYEYGGLHGNCSWHSATNKLNGSYLYSSWREEVLTQINARQTVGSNADSAQRSCASHK